MNPIEAMREPEPYVIDLSEVIRLSDDDLLKISAANPDLRIEQSAAGELEIMSPAFPISGARGVKVIVALEIWTQEHGDGVVFDSSAGFRLPNGALRAPDAAWVSSEVWRTRSPADGEGFARIVPEFLAEIRSSSDRLPYVQEKMREWMENGCRLGWLVDPLERKVHIYRRDGSVELSAFETQLSGEDVLPGFGFDPMSLP